MVRTLGNQTLAAMVTLMEIGELIGDAFRHLPRILGAGKVPVARVLLKQIYFTGIQTLYAVLMLALALGVVIITQVNSIADAGSGSLTGKVLVWVVVRELGPLLTALVVVARSGTAMATELAHMKLGGELEALEAMAIPVKHYLIMPRIFGMAIALFILSLYFQLTAVAGGFVVASLNRHVSYAQFLQGIVSVLTPGELALSGLKSFLFGLVVAATSCRQGLGVGQSITQVPQASTRAVMQSLLLVFLIDAAAAIVILR